MSATSSDSSGVVKSCLTNTLGDPPASSSFKALTLSFPLSLNRVYVFVSLQVSVRSRLAENFSDVLARLSCPRYIIRIQSGLNRSQSLTASPLTKYLLHTRSFLKGPFTRKKGYPSKRVNPSWKAKESPGLQAKLQRVWKQLES